MVCYEDQRAPRGYDKKMIHLEKTEIELICTISDARFCRFENPQ